MVHSNHKIRISLLIASMCGALAAFQSASFVQPAVPSIVESNTPAPTSVGRARHTAIVTGYGRTQANTGVLFAKKKGAAVKKGGKVQVKMLKFVEGTGRIGDVVTVSSAFWMNKLKKTNSAVMITDSEADAEKKASDTKAKEAIDLANDLKAKIEDIGTLSISKKAGPDGQLFGGVGKKAVLQSLATKFPKGCLAGKAVKVANVKDQDGSVLKHDIKEIGEYDITLALHAKVKVDFKVDITSEA